MEAPPKAPRRKGSVVVGVLFTLIAATAGGILAVRAKYGPSKACDYGAPAPGCAENEICSINVGGQGRCLNFAVQTEPMLPPFPRGVAFACRQGPKAPKDRSHAWGTDVYAVDLMPAPDLGEVTVTAPLDGEARVYDRCEERDASPGAKNSSNCGAGYGNHVRIWDGTDFVMLAHLARATVKDGMIVKRGDAIGVAGVSGGAGTRHVHVVVTRLRPGDHIGTILGSVGHKGGVVTRGLLRAKKDGAPVTTPTFDELGCGPDAAPSWTAP
jgi:hypothetical protein